MSLAARHFRGESMVDNDFISSVIDSIPVELKDEHGNAVVGIKEAADGTYEIVPFSGDGVRIVCEKHERCLIILDCSTNFTNTTIKLNDVYDSCVFIGGKNQIANSVISLSCGVKQTCVIGSNNKIWGATVTIFDIFSVRIGCDCLLGAGLIIRAGQSHAFFDRDTKKYFNVMKNCVTIGNHVWIALHVMISAKGSLPDNCIVGAKSFVNDSFSEEYCLIAGTPARVVRTNVDWDSSSPLATMTRRYCRENNLDFSWKYAETAFAEYEREKNAPCLSANTGDDNLAGAPSLPFDIDDSLRDENNNIFCFVTKSGKKKLFPDIPGIKITFLGKNNTVIVYESNIANLAITVKDSSSVVIQKTKHKIASLVILSRFFPGNVFIGEDFACVSCVICNDESESVIIGKDCLFSSSIEIRTSDGHGIVDPRSGRLLNRGKSVVIGDHVWVGAGVSILKGARVGANSIVGAKSVVTTRTPEEGVILAGIPAKVVKRGVSWVRKNPLHALGLV